ncbi:MAG: hypothetical protein GF331_11025 [Chitinivibrionales bacterium]|nr:hypothetical protein [Chitinivibrionales bacterium]
MGSRLFSQITLERYVLGELAEAERSELEKALSGDPDLQARVEHLRRSNEAILAQYPPDHMADQIERKAHMQRTQEAFSTRAPGKQGWRMAPAMGVLALLVLAAAPAVWLMRTGAPGTERIKGMAPSIVAYRSTPRGAVALANLDTVQAGDVLQVGYVAAGKPHGVLLSLDGRGSCTLHFPSQPGESTALEQDGEQLLDFAYELDDAPDFEHFLLVTSSQPIAVDAVLDSARAFVSRFGGESPPGKLGLPDNCRLTSLVLRK